MNVISNFEDLVEYHSLKSDDIMYNMIGLCGEVGELSNAIKKIEIRKALKPEEVVSMKSVKEYEENLKEELGDVLFYLVRIMLDKGYNVNQIIEHQLFKLNNQSIKYDRNFLK